MSTSHDTAAAVKALIDGATLSKTFDPRFVYDTDLPLEDTDTLHVDVVMAGLACAADSRVSVRYGVLVDVAVRYRFGTSEQETDGSIDVDEIEEYVALLEEIGELLAAPDNRKLATKTTATWVGNEIRFPWVPEHLRNNRQYTGDFASDLRRREGFVMAGTKYNANANRYVDTASGRFISFKTEAQIQLRLERIVKAAERSRAGNLNAVGYLISTIAKGLFQKSKQKSQPGQPPTTRRGLMRRAVRYEVAADRKSVVIGPVASMVGTAGQAHEFGGRYKGGEYPVRPFMGPALQEALPQIGPRYKVT